MILGILATACFAVSMVTNVSETSSSAFKVIRAPHRFGPIAEVKEPNAMKLRYGTINMMQLASDKVLALVNRGVYSTAKNYDFEDGTDLFVFGDWSELPKVKPIALDRSGVEPDVARDGKKRYHNRYPALGGFVPFGAKVGGKPHPYAGTGFLLSRTLTYPLSDDGTFDWNKGDIDGQTVMYALAYDGRKLSVKHQQSYYGGRQFMIGKTDWMMVAIGICTLIPDGVDLIGPAQAQVVKTGKVMQDACGMCRWKFLDGFWQPVDFVPICFSDEKKEHRFYEASLVRDAKGDLVFGVRDDGRHLPGKPYYCSPTQDLNAWRSADGGKTWMHIVQVDNVRRPAPMSIGRTAGGSVFFVSNPVDPLRTDPPDYRSRVDVWPVSADYSRVFAPVMVRDAHAEFRSNGTAWMLDHPNCQVLRLKDGSIRSYLMFRARDPHFSGDKGIGEPSPEAGSYAEEIVTNEKPVPLWEF